VAFELIRVRKQEGKRRVKEIAIFDTCGSNSHHFHHIIVLEVNH
jgi:hypothetical protein